MKKLIIITIIILLTLTPIANAKDKIKKTDKGKWIVHSERDALTNKKKIFFYLDADSGSNYLGHPFTLVIRYENNQTQLYINWNEYLSDNSFVKYKFDNGPINENDWNLSKDSTATFYPNNTTKFIKKIMKSNKFIARVTPYNSGPITAIFDVRGLENAAKPYTDTLAWNKTKKKTPQMMVARKRIPVYPKNVANKGIEGTVKLKIDINSNGVLSTVSIIKSSGSDSLDDVAKLTVERSWSFNSYKSNYSIILNIIFEDGKVKIKFIDSSL